MTGADDRAERSDWTDQDLLRRGDAVRRLDEEIAAIRAELGTTGDGERAVAARARLELLGRARGRIARTEPGG